MLKHWVTTVALLCASTAFGGEGTEIGGRVSLGTRALNFRKGETEHKAKLKFKTERHKNVRGIVKLEASSEDREVELEELYLDHKNSSDSNLKFGLAKKSLGLEYQRSTKKRLTIDRSPLYQKLATFALVGRDTTLEIEKEADDSNGFGYAYSLHYAESLDTALISHWHWKDADWNYGSWLLLQADQVDAGKQFIGVLIESAWFEDDQQRFAIEFAFGKDPIQSEFEKTFGNNDSIAFFAFKTEYAQKFDQLQPYFQASILGHDHREPKYNTQQVLVGCGYLWSKKIRAALEVEFLSTNSKLDLSKRSNSESSAKANIRYFF